MREMVVTSARRPGESTATGTTVATAIPARSTSSPLPPNLQIFGVPEVGSRTADCRNNCRASPSCGSMPVSPLCNTRGLETDSHTSVAEHSDTLRIGRCGEGPTTFRAVGTSMDPTSNRMSLCLSVTVRPQRSWRLSTATRRELSDFGRPTKVRNSL